MKNLKIIIMLPLLVLILLPLMIIDLIRVAKGKPSANEEWHNIYVDNDMSHRQGKKRERGFK